MRGALQISTALRPGWAQVLIRAQERQEPRPPGREDVPVSLTVGGVISNTVTIAVK